MGSYFAERCSDSADLTMRVSARIVAGSSLAQRWKASRKTREAFRGTEFRLMGEDFIADNITPEQAKVLGNYSFVHIELMTAPPG